MQVSRLNALGAGRHGSFPDPEDGRGEHGSAKENASGEWEHGSGLPQPFSATVRAQQLHDVSCLLYLVLSI